MPSTLTFGPADGDLLLLTTAEGRAARLGHALTLRVGAWEGALTLDGDVPQSVRLTAELGSLEVVEGRGGVKPLSSRDKGTIVKSATKTLQVDRFPVLTYTSTAIDGAYVVHGTVDLHGRQQPVDVAVTVDGETVSATTTITQTAFGISPYSQMLGALSVGDDVAVRLTVTLSR